MKRSFAAILIIAAAAHISAQQGQTVSFTNTSGLTLTALLFRSTNAMATAPAVVIMHGSGGMWRNDDPRGGVMSPNFREWATNLTTAGYAALFVDSYTPRGLTTFRSRRPAEDPQVDDASCSPAYERPKDAHAALRYLRTLPGINGERIGLIAFSQGAESALSAVLHRAVDRPWTSSYLQAGGSTTNKPMPAPPRLAPGEKGFAVALAFYPGCGFYGYYGSSSGTSAGLYLPETPTLILHGSEDSLYADNLYPERFKQKSRSEASVRNLPFNPLGLVVFAGAEHSFDEAQLAANPANDTADAAAKRAARVIAMDWLNTYLEELVITANPAGLTWPANSNTRYELGRSSNLGSWNYSLLPEGTAHLDIEAEENELGFIQLRAAGKQLELLP